MIKSPEIFRQAERMYSAKNISKNQIPLKEQVESLEIVADMLCMNDASKLFMLENFYKDYNIPTGFLPKYEHNGTRQRSENKRRLKT